MGRGVVGPRPLDGRGVFCTLACGVGGVGMLTFDELAHMVDATQLRFFCPDPNARQILEVVENFLAVPHGFETQTP